MIDSNQIEFAGATPENASLANWNWLKDRVQKSGFDPFHDWLEDQLLDLEANYEGWVTSKSRKLAQLPQLDFWKKVSGELVR